MKQHGVHDDILTRIAPEAALLLGAGRAILLQLANPQIGLAVVRQSGFVADPMRRLNNTLSYVYALGVGTEDQREAVIKHVNAVHADVRAPRDRAAGTPAYSARDPRLQLWVAATLYDSAELAASRTLPSLDAAEAVRLYRDYAMLGTNLQMPAELWPEDRHAFERYFQAQLETLQVDEPVRRAARELFAGTNAPWWARPLLPWVRDVTIVLLPGRVRDLYGYRLTAGVRRRARLVITLARWGSALLPRTVRHAPMRHALRRIDRGRM